MGRKTKAFAALARVRAASPQAVSAADAPVDEPSLAMRVLTARFHDAKARWYRDTFEAVVEMGTILRQGKKQLGEKYSQWIKEDLHVEQATAMNYIRVAELVQDRPGSTEQYQQIGVTKLYRIARMQ